MKVKKVTNTYKDGVLASSKEVAVTPAKNPETGQTQRTPKHHKVLDLAAASSIMLRQAADAQEVLACEVRKLRRQLIFSQRETVARTRERDALKKALTRKRDQVAGLRDHNDNLSSQVSGLEDDNKHLEEELGKRTQPYAQYPGLLRAVPVSRASAAPTTSEDTTTEVVDNSRAIAAKPIKK